MAVASNREESDIHLDNVWFDVTTDVVTGEILAMQPVPSEPIPATGTVALMDDGTSIPWNVLVRNYSAPIVPLPGESLSNLPIIKDEGRLIVNTRIEHNHDLDDHIRATLQTPKPLAPEVVSNPLNELVRLTKLVAGPDAVPAPPVPAPAGRGRRTGRGGRCTGSTRAGSTTSSDNAVVPVIAPPGNVEAGPSTAIAGTSTTSTSIPCPLQDVKCGLSLPAGVTNGVTKHFSSHHKDWWTKIKEAEAEEWKAIPEPKNEDDKKRIPGMYIQCPLCTARMRGSNFHRHFAKRHLKVEPGTKNASFPCKVQGCGSVSAYQRSLKRHMNESHSSLRRKPEEATKSPSRRHARDEDDDENDGGHGLRPKRSRDEQTV